MAVILTKELRFATAISVSGLSGKIFSGNTR